MNLQRNDKIQSQRIACWWWPKKSQFAKCSVQEKTGIKCQLWGKLVSAFILYLNDVVVLASVVIILL
jgi:hypothetical protein